MIIKLITLLLLLPCVLQAQVVTRNMHTNSRGRVEQTFIDASYERNVEMPVGWCDTYDLVYSSTGEYIAVYDFAKNEYFLGHKHIPNGADLSTLPCDINFHWCMSTSETAVVKLRLSMWHLYDGRVLNAIAAPDFVTDISLSTSTDDAAFMFMSNLSLDAMDVTTWNANKTINDEISYRFERLGAAEGDTHGGAFYLINGMVDWPSDGEASY